MLTQSAVIIADQIQYELEQSTSLTALSRKLITYWTLATHSLPTLETFPALVLQGALQCGKSTTMRIIESFAYKPKPAEVLRNMTLAGIRSYLETSQNQTVFFEESDSALHDEEKAYESFIGDRTSKRTARSKVKTHSDANAWSLDGHGFFGATVLHKRQPWRDPSVTSRCIIIDFYPNHTRTYKRFSPKAAGTADVAKQAQALELKLNPDDFLSPLSSRITDYYAPLLAVANLLKDKELERELAAHLEAANEEIREAQGDEPSHAILAALLVEIFTEGPEGPPEWGYKRISSLNKHLREAEQPLSSRQIASILRHLGLPIIRSHGHTQVSCRPDVFMDACLKAGYEDGCLSDLRRQQAVVRMPIKPLVNRTYVDDNKD